MKKLILFDLDGTLIDSIPDIGAAMNRTLERFGLPGFPTDEYLMKVGNGALKLVERSIGDHTELFDQVLQVYSQDYSAHCAESSHAYPGIPEALTALRQMGLKVVCLSNKDERDVYTVLTKCLPGFAFDAFRGRREGIPLKPDPAPALAMLRESGCTPEEALFVGDTPVDIRCGQNAGIETIAVTWGFRSEAMLIDCAPDHMVRSAQELTALVRSLTTD